MTRARSLEIVKYVYGILEFEEETVRYLIETKGIKNTMMIEYMKENDVSKLEHEDYFNFGNYLNLMKFKKWLSQYKSEHENMPPTDWETEFTEETFDSFMMLYPEKEKLLVRMKMKQMIAVKIMRV